MNPSNGSPHPRAQEGSSSTLRPRARRLISGLDDDEPCPKELPGRSNTSLLHLGTDTPPHSREHRPTQSITPSDPSLRNLRSTTPSSSHSFWDSSWSTLQGWVSEIMNNDDDPYGSTRSTVSTGLPPWRKKSRPPTSASSRPPPSQWGPAPGPPIGAGTDMERDERIRDLKRRQLLAANGLSGMDSSGRFKRRFSDDNDSAAGSVAAGGRADGSAEPDGDALVYLHHVKPGDTMAGLTIRFSCQASVLRKANRMWPNDPVQARKTILIPVEASLVKGKPCSGPGEKQEDLLGDIADSEEELTMHESPKEESPLPASPNGWHNRKPPTSDPSCLSQLDLTSSTTLSQSNSEPPWKHDSWVLLPNESQPTEIARLSRQTLGYFPRPRRKSNAASSSLATSRTTSFDLPRRTSIESAVTLGLGLGLPGSKQGSPSQSTHSSARRPRLPSRLSSASTAPHASFLPHGPGGVGSLSRSSRVPGPSQDPLNKLLGPHLPNVAPPPSQTVFTQWNPGFGMSGMEEDLISFGPAIDGSVAGVPGAGGGGLSDFPNVGGAIEGWVRKMAKKAGQALEGAGPAAGGGASQHSYGRGNVGVNGMALGSGVGDLIELVDAFEIGDEDGEDDSSTAIPAVESSGGNAVRLGDSEAGMRARGRRGKTD